MPSAATFLLAVVTILGSCSGSDSTAPRTIPPTTGSLELTVAGLPSAPAAVTVSGPGGFSRVVKAASR